MSNFFLQLAANGVKSLIYITTIVLAVSGGVALRKIKNKKNA